MDLERGLGRPRVRQPPGEWPCWGEGAVVAGHPADPTTGAGTRAALHDVLDRLWVGPRGVPVSLITVNVDVMKSINNALGHLDGTVVLTVVGERTLAVSRAAARRCGVSVDDVIVARVDGDSFAVALPGMTAPDAFAVAAAIVDAMVSEPVLIATPPEVLTPAGLASAKGYVRFFPREDGTYLAYAGSLRADRLRGRVEAEWGSWGPGTISVSGLLVSVSAGAASGSSGSGSWQDLLEHAGRALYDAKSAGRGIARTFVF